MRTKLLSILAVCLVMAGMISCDVTGDQNYDFEQGNTLAIVGPSSITLADDGIAVQASYYSKAFTINKEYTWNLSGEGAQRDSVYRRGEYMDVTFSETGTYTITVDDGEYQGSLDVTVEEE